MAPLLVPLLPPPQCWDDRHVGLYTLLVSDLMQQGLHFCCLVRLVPKLGTWRVFDLGIWQCVLIWGNNWASLVYSSLLSAAVVRSTVTKKPLGFLHLLSYGPPQRGAKTGTRGRHLEARTETKAAEEHCLLACSPFIYFYFGFNFFRIGVLATCPPAAQRRPEEDIESLET